MTNKINIDLFDLSQRINEMNNLIENYNAEGISSQIGFKIDNETGDFASALKSFDMKMNNIENMMLTLANSTNLVLRDANRRYAETDEKLAKSLIK